LEVALNETSRKLLEANESLTANIKKFNSSIEELERKYHKFGY
jgi:hypothetical protein